MQKQAFRELLRGRVISCASPWVGATVPGSEAGSEGGVSAGAAAMPREMAALEAFDDLVAAHRAALEAGADVLLTQTFAANRPALMAFDLQGKLPEIIRLSVEAARAAVAAAPRRGEELPAVGYWLGALPHAVGRQGGLTLEQSIEAYREVVRIARAQSPDFFVVEALGDLEHLRAALIALRSTAPEAPVVALMTFGPDGRTAEGSPPAVMWALARGLGADAVGASGSLAPAEMLRVAAAFAEVSDLPIACLPAAVPHGAEQEELLAPQEFGRQVKLLLGKGAAIAGCSGAHGVEHIQTLARAASRAEPATLEPLQGTVLTGRVRDVEIGPRRGLTAIAEWPALWGEARRAFADHHMKGLAQAVRDALRAPVQMLEVRCPLQPEEEPRFFDEFLPTLQSEIHLPLVIAAESRRGLEAALRRAVGRCLLAGVTGESRTWERVFPLAREYGAAVLAACHTGASMPRSAEERLEIAQRILEAAIAAGLAAEDLIFDPVVVAADEQGARVMEALRAIALIKAEMGQSTLLRAGRVGGELPGRGRLEGAFLAMAAAAGVDAVVLDGSNPRSTDVLLTSSLLAGRDRDARHYLAHFGDEKGPRAKERPSGEGTDRARAAHRPPQRRESHAGAAEPQRPERREAPRPERREAPRPERREPQRSEHREPQRPERRDGPRPERREARAPRRTEERHGGGMRRTREPEASPARGASGQERPPHGRWSSHSEPPRERWGARRGEGSVPFRERSPRGPRRDFGGEAADRRPRGPRRDFGGEAADRRPRGPRREFGGEAADRRPRGPRREFGGETGGERPRGPRREFRRDAGTPSRGPRPGIARDRGAPPRGPRPGVKREGGAPPRGPRREAPGGGRRKPGGSRPARGGDRGRHSPRKK